MSDTTAPADEPQSDEPAGPDATIDAAVEKASTAIGTSIPVKLNNDLAELLSKQLYRSPLKAIEELVVNSYDADAAVCRLAVPASSDQNGKAILVFDDGVGMDEDGLRDLWQIGRSTKRVKDEPTLRFKRKQIGRFGIGKLATYTIADRLTYFTKASDKDEKGEDAETAGILTVSIRFSDFMSEDEGTKLDVRLVTDWADLADHPPLRAAAEAAGLDLDALDTEDSWTIAYLEDLNEEAEKIKIGHLRRVLATAMPIETSFDLYLNGDQVESSKGSIEWVTDFDVADLSKGRFDALKDKTGSDWTKVPLDLKSANAGGEIASLESPKGAVPQNSESDGKPPPRMLVSELFPEGIRGHVYMRGEQTLKGGKSDDLMRSHGFFVYARGRLINAEDALFGLDPLSYESFNRMYAVVHADDLDQDLTAPREGVEDSDRLTEFREVLRVVFNEARTRRDEAMAEKAKPNANQGEGDRTFVGPDLIEHPVADVITLLDPDDGAEADGDWFYVRLPEGKDRAALAQTLYAEDVNAKDRTQYQYTLEEAGKQERLVRFDPQERTFAINANHEFAHAHMDDARSRSALRDFATAEAFLEVYLRGAGVAGPTVGAILSKRDALLRGLARDQPYSYKQIAEELRDAAAHERNLEFALVSAARALGFSATHVSGSNTPDGVAQYSSQPDGERKITLEAKSSKKVPSLSAIDFASLRTHVTDNKVNAQGCLLVAPGYPNHSDEDARAAKNARELRISCWTIEQLAGVVEVAKDKRITAADVLDIVLNAYSPDQVTARLAALMEERKAVGPNLYVAILDALDHLDRTMTSNDVRETGTIHGRVLDAFPKLPKSEVQDALADLQSATGKGLILVRDKAAVVLNTSLEDLRRRAVSLTNETGVPRRKGTFSNGDNPE